MKCLTSLSYEKPRAVFSDCINPRAHACAQECIGRVFRYELEWPTAGHGYGRVLFVLANPSTATHLKPDPTVTRCINYAMRWGFAWCGVVNVRAWRETDPKLMPEDPQAIGPLNDAHIAQMAIDADLVVCGWGKLGGTRGPEVLRIIRRVEKVPHALKLTKAGEPWHPLYLRGDLKPFPMAETCPCESAIEKPGPHLATCRWADPNYDDGAMP